MLEEEKLSSTPILREMRHVEIKLGNIMQKDNFLKIRTRPMKASTVREAQCNRTAVISWRVWSWNFLDLQ